MDASELIKAEEARRRVRIIKSDASRDSFCAIVQALSVLRPDERTTVMELVHDSYCPNCGYPAPPSDEDCSICKDAA
jgi:hypothetical protein